MAVEKRAAAVWSGNLLEGSGTVTTGSGTLTDVAVSWPKRAEQGADATSPEELIAAAHATCFSMALAHGLTKAHLAGALHEVEAFLGVPGHAVE